MVAPTKIQQKLLDEERMTRGKGGRFNSLGPGQPLLITEPSTMHFLGTAATKGTDRSYKGENSHSGGAEGGHHGGGLKDHPSRGRTPRGRTQRPCRQHAAGAHSDVPATGATQLRMPRLESVTKGQKCRKGTQQG